MHRRWLMGVLIGLVGESGCSEPDCTFEHVVADETAGHELRDCGSLGGQLGEPADLTPWRAARDCAITAAASREPFVVRWYVPGFEGATKYAFVGRQSGGAWSLAQFVESYNSDATTRPTVEYACAALGDQGDCAELYRTLCVTCGQGAVVRTCGE